MTYTYTSPKAIAIAEALQRRYPCAALPTGALTDLGIEFGVSREYARQIANHIGLTGTRGSRHLGGGAMTSGVKGSRTHNASGYTQGCRCDECRIAHRDYHRRSNAERRAIVAASGLPEGVAHGCSAYSNWGCRCRTCTGAKSAWMRDYAKRRKQEVPQ